MRSNLQYTQPYYTQDNRAVHKPFWARHAKEKTLKDFRMVNTPEQAPLPQFISRTPQIIYDQPIDAHHYSRPVHSTRSSHNFDQYLFSFRENWLYEEISFSMNKLSLTGLVFGLMVLGVVFFAIGFLSAMFTMAPGSAPQQTGHQASIWDRINTDIHRVEQSRTGQMLTSNVGENVADEVARHGGRVGANISEPISSSIDQSLQNAGEPHYPAYGYPTQAPAPTQQQRMSNQQQSAYGSAAPQASNQQAQRQYSQQQNPFDPRAQAMQQQQQQQAHTQYQAAQQQGYGPQTSGYAQQPTYSHPSAESTQWANQSAMRY